MPALRIFILIITLTEVTVAQQLELSYRNHVVVHENIDQFKKIGGLSGLTFDPITGIFLACADKFPARLLQFSYSGENPFKPEKITHLSPELISQSELEGIVFDLNSGGYYLSDEQADGTRIIKVDSLGRFEKVVLPINKPFLPLSSHNSGIEGLTLSANGNTLYFAFERPTQACFDQAITTIGKIDLSSGKISLFAYELHEVIDDHLNTNGISEILCLAEDRLLVMERAYLPGTGNVVRLYETNLQNSVNTSETPLSCQDLEYEPLRATLVFDFASVPEIKVDNAEGMTFNHDRSELLIITDNNFSQSQQTQLITLAVINR